MTLQHKTLLVAVVTLAAVVVAIPGSRAQTPVVTLYPVFKGSCAPAGGSSSGRELALSPEGATECAQLAPGPSLRNNEEYQLVERVSGIVAPAGAIAASFRFDQELQSTKAPGYVDAVLRLAVNDEEIADLRAVGSIPADAPFEIGVDVPIPPFLRSKPVRSATLTIEWNPGTSPGVEPVMDGSTYIKVPLANARQQAGPTVPTGSLQVKFDPQTTVRRCPRDAPRDTFACYDVRGTGRSKVFGKVRFRRTQFAPARGCSSTRGTLFLRHGTVTFKTVRTKCDPFRGGATYHAVFDGGTKAYEGAHGSLTIEVPRATRRRPTVIEKWRGRLSI